MSGVKISALPAVGSCALTDLMPEVQPASGGTTYKATLQQVFNLFSTHLVIPSTAGTAGTILRSDGTNFVNTTATYPATTTINQLLYSSAANTIGGLATGNNGTLITSAGGVPSISSTLPNAVQTNITALGAQSQALNMNSHLINNVTDPSAAQDAATKAYVDAVATGLNIQANCVCASTTAFTVTYANGTAGVGATLTNAGAMVAFSADGVSPTVGQRVLIKNQASALQNGIYTVTTVGSGAVNWVLTRATDFDTPTEIQPGDLCPILTGGTTQGGSSWMQTATVAAVGVDAINFIQFSTTIPVTVPNGGTGLTTITAHDLIIGNGTSNVTLLAPSATAGVPLVSAGAAADPAYGTAVVAGGGTGLTSATAYAVLCGGTTTTNPFQSVAALGSSGDFLTSNGAGVLPTFQTKTIPAAATQADQEAATSTTTYVSPGRQQFHPSSPKAWVGILADGSGLNGSYNVSSISDLGTGNYRANYTVNLSTSGDTCHTYCNNPPSATPFNIQRTGTAVSSVTVLVSDVTGVATDAYTMIAAFGDI